VEKNIKFTGVIRSNGENRKQIEIPIKVRSDIKVGDHVEVIIRKLV